MHPADCPAKFPEYPAQKGLVDAGVLFGGRDKVEKFTTGDVFENEDMIGRRVEGVDVRHD